MVSVELPEALNVGGANIADAAPGNPLIPNATLPLKPAFVVTVTVKFVLLPAFNVCNAGDAERVKLDTMSVTVLVCAKVPVLPITVIG